MNVPEDRKPLLIGEFKSAGGLDNIYFKSNLARSPSKKHFHLIILHDWGEYHRRYLDIGHYLIGQLRDQVSLSWIDLLGHGLSGGTRAHIDVFDYYCKDILSFIEAKGEEVLLLGQGLGALIALKIHQSFEHLLPHPLKGLILSNPALKFCRKFSRRMPFLLPSYFGPLKKLKVPFPLKGEMLGHDPDRVADYNADPLISHSLTIGLFEQISRVGATLMETDTPLEIPTLALFSGKENLYDREETRPWMEKICEKRGKIRDYPSCRHDLFNEIQRDVVFQDVYNWIKHETKL